MGIVRPIVQECFIPEQYTSSPEIIKNCLKDVLNEGIINSQVSAPVENEDMTKKQKETIIKNTWSNIQLNIMNQIIDGILSCRMKIIHEK